MSGHGGGHANKSNHGLKKQDLVSLIITFAIGMVAGGYLYLTGFAPQFESLSGQTEAVYDDLIIVGEEYGGDRTGSAPSFQVLNDGTFRYLESASASEEIVSKEGVLPTTLLKAVKKRLLTSVLEKAQESTSAASCASYVDGLDYQYTITLQNVVYELDSCGTEFTTESTLGVSLEALWNYFRTLE